MKVRPLQDRILVQRIEEEEVSAGGIIIPDSAKEKPSEGKVIACGKGKGRCPRGGARLRAVEIGDGDGSITIDRCPHEHGLWFDRGEMKAVIGCSSKGSEPEAEAVAAFFADMFQNTDAGNYVKFLRESRRQYAVLRNVPMTVPAVADPEVFDIIYGGNTIPAG